MRDQGVRRLNALCAADGGGGGRALDESARAIRGRQAVTAHEIQTRSAQGQVSIDPS